VILLLWLSLLFLSLVICILGYYTDDEPYFTVGAFFIFLLGIVIMSNQLEYQTGSVTNTTYTYTDGNLTSEGAAEVFTYTAWNDADSKIVGYLLSIIGGIGFALSLRTQRKKKQAEGMVE
jgi:uncharacterized membrane protein YkvI